MTQVASALVSGALVGVLCEGSASRCSARAILSGSRSLISTNSSDWILSTSLPGIGGGGKLEASWNCEDEGPGCSIGDGLLGGALAARGDAVEVRVEPAEAVAGRRGMLAMERGTAPKAGGGVPG